MLQTFWWPCWVEMRRAGGTAPCTWKTFLCFQPMQDWAARLEGEGERLYYIHKIFLRDEGKLYLMNIQCAVMGRSLVRICQTSHAFCISEWWIVMKQESIKLTLKGEKPKSGGNFMPRTLIKMAENSPTTVPHLSHLCQHAPRHWTHIQLCRTNESFSAGFVNSIDNIYMSIFLNI